MTSEHDNSYKLVGAAMAAVAASLPPWAMDTSTKLLLTMVTAFLGAVGYRAGQIFMDSFRRKKRDDDR